jgi:hypothetical protein
MGEESVSGRWGLALLAAAAVVAAVLEIWTPVSSWIFQGVASVFWLFAQALAVFWH